MVSLQKGHKNYVENLVCISVVGLAATEIQNRFGLSKSTAWRASKKGFFLQGYGDKKRETKKRVKIKERIGDYIYALEPKFYFYIFNLNISEKLRDELLDYFTTRKYDICVLNNPIAYVNWVVKNKLKNEYRKNTIGNFKNEFR